MSSAYTHGHAESVLRSHRARTAANSAAYLLPHLPPGQRLLDVGAGPGHGQGALIADAARGPHDEGDAVFEGEVGHGALIARRAAGRKGQ